MYPGYNFLQNSSGPQAYLQQLQQMHQMQQGLPPMGQQPTAQQPLLGQSLMQQPATDPSQGVQHTPEQHGGINPLLTMISPLMGLTHGRAAMFGLSPMLSMLGAFK